MGAGGPPGHQLKKLLSNPDSTANTFLCAFRFNHKLLGLPDTASTFTIKKMHEGYRRSKPTRDIRLPIVYEILYNIRIRLETVCTCRARSLRMPFFHGRFYSSFLRSSEQPADATLFEQDIIAVLPASSFQVCPRRSKTNQQGPPVFIPSSCHWDFCLPSCVHDHLPTDLSSPTLLGISSYIEIGRL